MLICLSMKSDWKSSLTWGLKMWVSVMMEQSWSMVSVNRPFVVKSLVPFGQLFMIALSFLASRMMVLLPICWMKSSVSMVFCTKWLHLCSWCGIPKKRVPKQEFLMFVWRRLVFGQMKVLPLCVFSVWQCSKSVFVSSVPEWPVLSVARIWFEDSIFFKEREPAGQSAQRGRRQDPKAGLAY